MGFKVHFQPKLVWDSDSVYVHGPSSREATFYKKLILLTALKLAFGFFVDFFLPTHRIFLATQNDGLFPEWTFPANTSIFRHNCSSVPPDERALRKRCLWKGPSPEFSKNLQRGTELLGFFAALFLHASFPSCPLLSRQRPCFFDSTNLSKAQTEGPRGALTAMNGAPIALCPSTQATLSMANPPHG